MFCKHCAKELKEAAKFCTNCGNTVEIIDVKAKRRVITKKNILIASVVIVLILITIFFVSTNKQEKPTFEQKDQDIASTVVNIYCEGATEDITSGGSGTILTADGLVLTNAHIIPQGKNASPNTKSCVVILPDPTTGSPKEMYYGKPLIIADISEKYDLAFVQIDDVYYDKETNKVYGEYPKKFPAYDSDLYCKNENVKLGEPVRVYGYPAISGGYALTITDGIVSSLLSTEGYIITSAKISHGNSGGLAVDSNGCMIGVPSMVSGDENESLGVIISDNIISEFIDKASEALK